MFPNKQAVFKMWSISPIIDHWSSHRDKWSPSWEKQTQKSQSQSSHPPCDVAPCYCLAAAGLLSLLGCYSIGHVSSTRPTRWRQIHRLTVQTRAQYCLLSRNQMQKENENFWGWFGSTNQPGGTNYSQSKKGNQVVTWKIIYFLWTIV